MIGMSDKYRMEGGKIYRGETLQEPQDLLYYANSVEKLSKQVLELEDIVQQTQTLLGSEIGAHRRTRADLKECLEIVNKLSMLALGKL
jgi:hypothetical protein